MGKERTFFHKELHYINKTISFCENILLVIACISLFLIVFVICYGMIGREFFNLSVLWTNEAASYLMIYLTFFSIPWILRVGGHVNISIFVANLSVRKLTFLNKMIYTLCALVMAIFFLYSLSITVNSYQRGTVLLDSVAWPQYLLLLPMPIGSFFLCVRFILSFFQTLSKRDEIDRELSVEAGTNNY